MAEEQASLQDVMSGDLFAGSKPEMVEVLNFMEKHSVPLTDRQVAGIAFLKYLDQRRNQKLFTPIGNTVLYHAKDIASPRVFIDVIESMTLADRIKGNVRMNNLFKNDK